MARPLTICAIFRNEAPYLREWIEFHLIAGVSRFYLYQHLSTDDWAPVLRPYIDARIVEVIDWPVQVPAQLPAFRDHISRHKGADEWTAFIDCDEFLFAPNHSTIAECLDHDAFRAYGAVAVNWMCFGASGLERQDPRPVVERFTERPKWTFDTNLNVKSLVRMDRVEGVTDNAHWFSVEGGTCDEKGAALPTRFMARASHERLRINHYITKSRQEFTRRISVGRVDYPVQRHPSEFELYQARDVDDRVIWQYLPELKKRLGGCERAECPEATAAKMPAEAPVLVARSFQRRS